MWAALIGKLEDRSALVGIVGLGYVGLPVATSFAAAGYKVLGVDTDGSRVARLRAGNSYIQDVADDQIEELVGSGRLRASTSYRGLAQAENSLRRSTPK